MGCRAVTRRTVGRGRLKVPSSGCKGLSLELAGRVSGRTALGRRVNFMTLTRSSLARHVVLPDHGVGLDGQSCSCLIVGWPVGLSSPTLGVGHPSVMFLFDCWPVGRPMPRTTFSLSSVVLGYVNAAIYVPCLSSMARVIMFNVLGCGERR
ncbi:hypothetical protein F2Q70_00030788 [Brassica cretica]|uniref:Uncharacterized protein n=1 Tax=Brassica cretica TaxID=69181 RepID=A0A8S9FT52_BRACR|nr:hypothetical protein F2Q70_00030788 [Brassica cretica]